MLSIGYRGFRHLDTLLNGSNDFDETLMEWVPGVIYLVGWVATTGKPRGEKHRGKLFSHIKPMGVLGIFNGDLQKIVHSDLLYYAGY